MVISKLPTGQFSCWYSGGLSQGSPQKGFVSRLSQGKGLFGLSEGSWGVELTGLSGGSWGNRTIIGSKGAGCSAGGGLTDGAGTILWVAKLIISSWKWEVDLAWKMITTPSAPCQKATNPLSKVKRRTPHTSSTIIACHMLSYICMSSMKIKSISSNHHWLLHVTAGGIGDIRWQTPQLSRAHNLSRLDNNLERQRDKGMKPLVEILTRLIISKVVVKILLGLSSRMKKWEIHH